MMIIHAIEEHFLDIFWFLVANVYLRHRIFFVEGRMEPLMIIILHACLIGADSLCEDSRCLNCSNEWRAFDDHLIKLVLLDISLQIVTCFFNLSYSEGRERWIALDIIVDIFLWSQVCSFAVSYEYDLTHSFAF